VDPVERASRAIEAGRAAAKPRGTDVAGSAPARTVRRAPAVKAEAPRGDEAPGESAATTAPAAEEAAPRTPPAPTEERAAAPEAPASEPARPQKAPKKTREKNPAGIDMDATLPPSLGD
jgi:hypothetical protein